MTPEEAYAETLRRIREAGEMGVLELDLSGLETLNLLPVELERLTSLRTLNLYACKRLSDLLPLTGLTSLQTLNLSGCGQLSDLTPLATLTSLQTLNLSGQLSDLTPLATLTSLQTLDLSWCEQLSDLTPLAILTSLQTLDLSGCGQLSDLTPLAILTSLQTLDLSGCGQLSDLTPLATLTSLQTLHLSGCGQLSDLTPLATLTSLQTLPLSECDQLSGDLTPLATLTSLQTLLLSGCKQLHGDLGPLGGLTALQWLDLSNCEQLREFAPTMKLLPSLQGLYLDGCKFDDLPREVCGESDHENVLDKVRAHYEDLWFGQRIDAEVKVLFLGNGGVGKTQLCRRLRDLEFDPSVPTTHGIQLGHTTVTLENVPEPVRLNLWDFGGQDIYHGSHALFLHGQAIFVILWTLELEQSASYEESGVLLRHRLLSYWLDYLRAFAGTDASVLVVQSQCDTRDKRILHPPAPVDDFPFHRYTEVSARTGLNLGVLKEHIKEAVRDRLDRRPPPPIGVGRLKVRDLLRQMLEEDQKREPAKRQHRLLEPPAFDRMCDEAGGISDKEALLDFLHHNGVIFYRPGLFGGRIVLDQNWALEAIYSIFHRDKCFKQFKKLHGRFSQEDLELLIWSDYTPEEEKVFLGMMESCGICFEVRKLPNDEWEYIAPELLPEWSDAQEQLLGRLRDDPPDAEASAGYTFLHEGILRNFLSKLGDHAKDAAIYWKYGCWFYEQTTRSQVLIETIWDDASSEAGAGSIRLRAWGENAERLIELVLDPLRKLPVGQAPKIEQTKRIHVQGFSQGNADIGDKAAGLIQLQITARPELPPKSTPEVFVSYAWGDDSSKEARKRTEVVDQLCETLGQDGWNIIRDKNAMRSGDLISDFMKLIGQSDHVIVVLSDKYLRSPYCMTELHYLYLRSLGQKEDFLLRIIPLVLADARFGTWRDRLVYTKHWRAEFEEMEHHFKDLGEVDFRLYKAMQDWHNRIGDMLAYVNDVLTPHGFDDIVKGDFAGLRQMLSRRIDV
jgi:internalin A